VVNAVDGYAGDFAVFQGGGVDFFDMTESQAHVGDEFLFAGVGRVSQGVHVGVDERSDLHVVGVEDHFGDLIQDRSFRQSLHDHIASGDADGRGFQFVQQDRHQYFLDFFGHDISQLSQSQDGFATGQGAVLRVDVADDFFQFENAQVQTSVTQSFQVGQFLFPFGGAVQFVDQQFNVLFFQLSRAESLVGFFHFTSPFVLVVGAEGVHQGANAQPDALFQHEVSFADFRFGQFQQFVDDFFRWSFDVDQIFQAGDGSQSWDFLGADFFYQQFNADFGAAGGDNVGHDVADFFQFFRIETVGVQDDLFDLFQFLAGAHAEQGDQLAEIFGHNVFNGFGHFADHFFQQADDQLRLVLDSGVHGLAQQSGVLFHVEGLFGDVPVQGVDHIRIGFDGLTWFFDAAADWAGFDQHQVLVDVGHDDVGFFVERNEGVFAFNSGVVDQEVAGATDHADLADGAGFQEFFRFDVFRIAGGARVGEAEVVFDFGASFAFFEVDRFGYVHNGAGGHFGGFGYGVQGFAFAFNGFLHNAIEDVDVVDVAAGFNVGHNVQDIQGLLFALNVDLEHVDDTAFNVGRPRLFFTIENDVFDHAVDVVEFDGQQQFLFQHLFDRDFFEVFEFDQSSGRGQFAVDFTHANVFQLHQAHVLAGEQEGHQRLNSCAAVLFA